ncbi:Haloacid dehalogenase-like hydrolase [Janibacter sp. HTCC2649]|uniref:HAD family hydrolase n=1 Tax=Janibacter sp. HTCC2649 TaxID=313589 RepID=UPI0000670A41|nr:HAD family phosphatase [Janibacter sp. HTCC2649]EAQ00307.1 Haloacid dehalogenase-like hydrolase [Janibacter sp. HTCC2649]
MSSSHEQTAETDSVDQWAPLPVDAVVFDLGNVLIRWDPTPAVAAAVGAERAHAFLTNEAFDFTAWNAANDAGRSFEEAEREAVSAHPHLEQEIRGYRTHFGASLVEEIAGTVEILRELHAADIPVLALTNWAAETFPVALDRFDFLDLFEDIIVSGEEGVAKPDPEIFEILEERMSHLGGLDDCIFIDDSLANVEAAQEAGLDAIHFTDPENLRQDLVVRGLPLRSTRPSTPQVTGGW